MKRCIYQDIDVSGTNTVALDRRLNDRTRETLERQFDTVVVEHGVYPNQFALPNIIGHRPDLGFVGNAFILSPTAKVSKVDAYLS